MTIGRTDSEKSVVINGNVYRSAFYPNYLWINDIKVGTTGIQVGNGIYYPVSASDYSLYQSDYASGKTGGEIYCLSEQWDAAYAQYHNGGNYSFMVGNRPDFDDDCVPIKPEWNSFDVLAGEYYEIDHLHWKRSYVGKTKTLALAPGIRTAGRDLYIRAVSNDGRFRSAAIHLLLHEGGLFCFVGMDAHYGAYETRYYIPVSETVGPYFVNLLNEKF